MSLPLNEYQQLATRTANYTHTNNFETAVLALGVAGEAGEVADYIKKVVGHGHKLDLEKLEKELGDVLWYVAVLAFHHGITLESVAIKNIEKLMARYPDGFKTENSVVRKEGDI